MSEELRIALRERGVDVQVDYEFLNHGATKALDYGFPFAVGERSDGAGGATRLGEPSAYALLIDGRRVDAVVRGGGPVPADIPVPALDAGADASYRWTYRVSRVEFPAAKPVRVSVVYSVPYLHYSKSSERLSARSPGEFSYILSTGGGWRGGTIGSVRVIVTSAVAPLGDFRVEGLPLVRERSRWLFEARDFHPTPAANLVLRRSEWARLKTALSDPATGAEDWLPWTSAPVGPNAPAALRIGVEAPLVGAGVGGPVRHFRLGLAFAGAASTQFVRARLALQIPEREPDVFHVILRPTSAGDVAANGGWRYVRFDTAGTPEAITLTLTEVPPGAGGERRAELDEVILEEDVSDDRANVLH